MKIEFDPGTHIAKAAEQLVSAAREYGEASCEFNGIGLVADSKTTAAQVIDDFQKTMEAMSVAYKNSPAGKKAERDRDASRAAAQQKHDMLMRKLPRLDMRDDTAVLDWLCEMQEPSDHVGVIVQRDTILQAFARAGFVAGENCGEDYKPGDRDNMFRYLVGQCLDGLNGPAIHPIIHKFADEWRQQFAR